MRCEDFLEAFPAVSDGVASPATESAVRAHRGRCPRCDRYARVLDGGLRLLEQLPPVEPSDSFHPRLEHRLLHAHDEIAALRRGGAVSATTAAAAVTMAVLLLVVAWSASISAAPPRVVLPAVVASPPGGPQLSSDLMTRIPQSPIRLAPSTLFAEEIWTPSQPTLYQYSPLRYRYESAVSRSGLD